ncbi:MAG: PEP-CTERM sorting domain-containing protein [Crocosphaera sp.]
MFKTLSAVAISSTSALISATALASDFNPKWDFNFTGNISGLGTIELDLTDEINGAFLVDFLDFTLDFGDGNGDQSLSLNSFSLSQPLRFNPIGDPIELTSLSGNGWNFGVVPLGGFVNLAGSPNPVLPQSSPSGAISFAGNTVTNGFWTATPTSVPEPSSLLGLVSVLGLGLIFKFSSTR